MKLALILGQGAARRFLIKSQGPAILLLTVRRDMAARNGVLIKVFVELVIFAILVFAIMRQD